MDIVKLKNDVKSVVAFLNSDFVFNDPVMVFRIIMNTATASTRDPFQAVYLYLSCNNFSRILMGRQKIRGHPPKKHLEISISLPIFTLW
jgi:hypothetical protein